MGKAKPIARRFWRLDLHDAKVGQEYTFHFDVDDAFPRECGVYRCVATKRGPIQEVTDDGKPVKVAIPWAEYEFVRPILPRQKAVAT